MGWRVLTLASSVICLMAGCLYGLHGRLTMPPTVLDHLWSRLTDPRPWVFVIMPVAVAMALHRGGWHGSPTPKMRHGGRHQSILTVFSESTASSVLCAGGLALGLVASSTGLAPAPGHLALWPVLVMMTLIAAASTALIATFVATMTMWRPVAGWLTAIGILGWAVLEVGLPTTAPPHGPVAWTLQDLTDGVSILELLPLALIAALGMSLLSLAAPRRVRGPLVVGLVAASWSAAAPRLLAARPPDSGAALRITWWGHGQGQFDAQVFTLHWAVVCLPVLWVLSSWDASFLRHVPQRVLAHGSPRPVLLRAFLDMGLMVVAGTLGSWALSALLHGSEPAAGLPLATELLLVWMLHTLVWGGTAVIVAWWWGDNTAGLVVLVVAMLVTPLIPWERSHLPFGLAALGQETLFSWAWLWLLPAVAALTACLRLSPLPRQGRDL